MKETEIDPRFKSAFEKMFIGDYLESLDDIDCFEIPYFEGEEKEKARELVAA